MPTDNITIVVIDTGIIIIFDEGVWVPAFPFHFFHLSPSLSPSESERFSNESELSPKNFFSLAMVWMHVYAYSKKQIQLFKMTK